MDKRKNALLAIKVCNFYIISKDFGKLSYFNYKDEYVCEVEDWDPCKNIEHANIVLDEIIRKY